MTEPTYGGIHGQLDASRLTDLINMLDDFEESLAGVARASRSGNVFAIVQAFERAEALLDIHAQGRPFWESQLVKWKQEGAS